MRGHRTTLLSAPQFRPAADSVGADFAALGTAEAYERIYAHPDLWHPRRGLGVFFPYVAGLAGQTADLIEERYIPGKTVVVATFQSFGARVAQEALGVPLCTVLPNPILLQSTYDPNRNPIANPPRWLGRGAIRLMYHLVNREVSRHSRDGIGGARLGRGLSQAIRDVVAWSYSPDLVLGLWPRLLSAPQPDWPRQARTTGFVAYDGPDAEGWTPPAGFPGGTNWLVFTPGTRMTHGAAFFRAACSAAAELGRPTIMVAKDRSSLPDPLPENVTFLPYAPFTWLFSRADGVVHHGGIGTAGRALSAGLPQLIVPSGFDQFDNAARVTRAGVGLELHRKRLSSRSLLQSLRRLLESEPIRRRCEAIRSELLDADPLTEVCLAVEDLVGA
jgi:UDP:flavonoid glycosyltransferase YjiC (YdhE family)